MSLEWVETDRALAARQSGQSGLAVALLVSALLHGGLAGGILWLSMLQNRHSSSAHSVSSTISIALLRPAVQPEAAARVVNTSVSVPQRASETASVETSEPVNEVTPVATPEQGQEVALDTETSLRPAVTEIRPAPAVPATTPALTPQPTTAAPGTAPSLSTLRQAVRQLSSGFGGLTGQGDCNAGQLRNRLLNCERADLLGSTLEVPPRLMLSFNQADGAGQGAEAAAIVEENHSLLQDRLSAAGLDAATAGYLRQELLQGIEVYNATGNTRLQRLEQQVYRNDAAYQQARRVMNPR